MTKEQLNLAGWLSITNAAITIPIFVFSVFLEAAGGAGAKAVMAILNLVSLGLFIYIILSLKNLLNSRFRFYDVDTYISVLIWVNVFVTVLSILSSAAGQLETLFGVFSVFVIIPYGIVAIVFAVKILRISGDLYGLLKPFSYTTIAGGLCLATIILIPLALLMDAVASVILGMIFFRAAEQPFPKSELVVGAEKFNPDKAIYDSPTDVGIEGGTFPRAETPREHRCTRCGVTMGLEDKFCSSCGYPRG